MGIAFSQASGTRQPIHEAALVTRLHTGFAARNAVTAAYLARAGISAAHGAFEGPNGFFPLYQRGDYDRDAVLGGLGETLLSSLISTKPFPGARPVHALMEAAMDLRSEAPDEVVASARVFVPPALSGLRTTGWPVGREAAYSLAFGVALVLANGEAPIEAFVEPDPFEPSVRPVLEHLQVLPDDGGHEHGVVEVTYESGRVARRVALRATGHPGAPLGEAEQSAKLWRLYDYGRQPIDRPALERAVELIADFEEVASTSELTSLLAATGAGA